MSLKVTTVKKGTLAERIGISPGDEILTINGEIVYDYIDYQVFLVERELSLRLRKANGSVVDLNIVKKTDYEELGIEFKDGKCRACANKCIFCFIDQLPEGMRDTLYFKDDDWRRSYMMGNYITLTNVGDREFERILRRGTPLYISVHATDPEVRAKILNTNKHVDILPRLKQLSEHGICFECQAVIAAGVNDGKVLEKTISDLMKLQPYAQSLALVPVGITAHRDGLYPLSVMEKQQARDIIAICERFQQENIKKDGTRFVFCSDEMYFRAELPLPSFDEYEYFTQLEDGVGLVVSFFHDARLALEECDQKSVYNHVTIACGTDVAPLMRDFCDECSKKLGLKISVCPIVNDHFGHSITVSGLMTGRDLIAQLKDKELGERLFFTKSALREFESVFLDDITLSEICDILNIQAVPVPNDGYCFIDAISGLEVNE